MKNIKLIAAAMTLAAASRAFAGTIDFEAVPFGANVDGFYAGASFSGATITTVAGGYPGFGNQVVYDSAPSATIVLQFYQPQTQVSFYYGALAGMTVNYYDPHGNLIDSVNLAGTTTWGTSGIPTLSGINTGIANISTIDFIDETTIPGFEVLDNISAPGITGLPAPDAASTLGLMGLAGFGLFIFHRKVRTC